MDISRGKYGIDIGVTAFCLPELGTCRREKPSARPYLLDVPTQEWVVGIIQAITGARSYSYPKRSFESTKVEGLCPA